MLDDVTSFIGWLASIDDRLVDDGIRDGIRRMAERGESGDVHDTAGHVDPESLAAVIAEWAGRRPNAIAPSPNDLDRIVHILQDPVEFKGILVFTVARFWQNHFRTEYADCARQIERNVEYQHHRSYPGAFSDYYAEVTGTSLPQRAVEDHPNLDTPPVSAVLSRRRADLVRPPAPRSAADRHHLQLSPCARRRVGYPPSASRHPRGAPSAGRRDALGDPRLARRARVVRTADRRTHVDRAVDCLAAPQSHGRRRGSVIERPENGMKFYRIHVERLAGLARRLTLFRAPLGDMESGASPEEEE